MSEDFNVRQFRIDQANRHIGQTVHSKVVVKQPVLIENAIKKMRRRKMLEELPGNGLKILAGVVAGKITYDIMKQTPLSDAGKYIGNKAAETSAGEFLAPYLINADAFVKDIIDTDVVKGLIDKFSSP